MGALSFFFSAYLGQIDFLVDDGDKTFRKYHIIVRIGPLCVLLMLVPILLSPTAWTFKIGCCIVGIVISGACCFHV